MSFEGLAVLHDCILIKQRSKLGILAQTKQQVPAVHLRPKQRDGLEMPRSFGSLSDCNTPCGIAGSGNGHQYQLSCLNGFNQ